MRVNVMKFVAALVAVAAMAIQSTTSDDVITNPEWVQIASQLFAAAGVYLAANYTLIHGPWHYVKGIVAGLGAGFVAWGGYLANNDHLTNSMWWNVAISVVGAIVVFFSPPAPEVS
jgi:hypothetical protein